MRLWNYNKSRIHSFRGVREVEISLDEKTVFRGEIRKAPGLLTSPEQCCEVILFTDQERLLQRIDRDDWVNNVTAATEEPLDEE